MVLNQQTISSTVSTFITDVKATIRPGTLDLEAAVRTHTAKKKQALENNLAANLDILIFNLNHEDVDTDGCQILMQTVFAYFPELIETSQDLLKVLNGVNSPQKREVIVDYYKDNEILMYNMAKTPVDYKKLRTLVPTVTQMDHIAEKLYNRWETIYLACRVAQNTPRYKKSNAANWIPSEHPGKQERLGAVIQRAADPEKLNGRTGKAWSFMGIKGNALAQHVYAYGYNRSSYGTSSRVVLVTKGYMYDSRITKPETEVNMNNVGANNRLNDATRMLKELADVDSRPKVNTSVKRIHSAPWPKHSADDKTNSNANANKK